MPNNAPKIGFSYFSSKEYYLDQQIQTWLSVLKRWGSSVIVLEGNFDIAIPEDIFINAMKHSLEPIIHFKAILPTARSFNQSAFLLDIYKKWGADYVILGDQPNQKLGWSLSDWQDDALPERFLDRFIPLANHAVRIGLNPVLAPPRPGGDYWDCSFLEMVLSGLKQRKLTHILDTLILSSYGWTFNKPLTWGQGGPEQWPGSKPYQTPAGQEDQIGFHNFEWLQAVSQRIIGRKLPAIILDACQPGVSVNQAWDATVKDQFKRILLACSTPASKQDDNAVFNDLVLNCNFSLETMKQLFGADFSIEALDQIFLEGSPITRQKQPKIKAGKTIPHYLLLPAYASGVSDVVLNKVRPLIKMYQPTVGFSLQEAACAAKVSIFPDKNIFSDEDINQLRAAGCEVEILPESGIEIATLLQK